MVLVASYPAEMAHVSHEGSGEPPVCIPKAVAQIWCLLETTRMLSLRPQMVRLVRFLLVLNARGWFHLKFRIEVASVSSLNKYWKVLCGTTNSLMFSCFNCNFFGQHCHGWTGSDEAGQRVHHALDALEPRLCESSAFYPAHGLQGVLGMVKSPKKCGQSQVEVEWY